MPLQRRHADMITVIISDFKEITANNYKAHTACLAIHELMCSCGHKGCFVRHAYYRRLLKTKKGTITLNILRVKCKGCGRTHAILPELVVPYSQCFDYFVLTTNWRTCLSANCWVYCQCSVTKGEKFRNAACLAGLYAPEPRQKTWWLYQNTR